MNNRIYIIEDDISISTLLKDYIDRYGFEAVVATNFNDIIEEFEVCRPSLILLDINLPKFDGFYWCTKIRQKSNIPIIFISARESGIDQIRALESGGDDYITKPFIIEELVARVKAHIRRNNRVEVSNIIKIGEIEINLDSYEVYKNNSLIDLSTREFELLAYLMKNAGIVLSKEKIFNSVWGENYGEIGTVAVHIKSLRNKLDPDEKCIKTIWGLGYKFIKVLDEH